MVLDPVHIDEKILYCSVFLKVLYFFLNLYLHNFPNDLAFVGYYDNDLLEIKDVNEILKVPFHNVVKIILLKIKFLMSVLV